MAGRTGNDAKLYRNTGTFGTPTWNEITICRDLTLDMTQGEADATVRGASWRATLATIKEANIDVEILHDPLVDDYNVLRDAFLNKTVLDVAVADGAIATPGTQYFRADVQVFGFSRNEPLEDAITVTTPLKVTSSANAPSFTTVP